MATSFLLFLYRKLRFYKEINYMSLRRPLHVLGDGLFENGRRVTAKPFSCAFYIPAFCIFCAVGAKKNLSEKRRDQKQKSKTEQSTSLTAVATQTTKAKARHENDFLLLIADFAVIRCAPAFCFFVRLIIQQMLSLVNGKCKKIYSKFNNGEDENLCNVMIFAKRKIDLRGICVA